MTIPEDGFILQNVGNLPATGDTFRYECLSVTATATEERRVTEREILAKEFETTEDENQSYPLAEVLSARGFYKKSILRTTAA